MSLEADVRKEFEGLLAQMSPENLACDGELSRTQVNARSRALVAQWGALERKVGRSVSEEEVFGNTGSET